MNYRKGKSGPVLFCKPRALANQGTASAITPSVSIPVPAMLRVKSLGSLRGCGKMHMTPGPKGNMPAMADGP